MREEYRAKSVLGRKKYLVLERHPNCYKNLGPIPAPLELVKNLEGCILHAARSDETFERWETRGSKGCRK